jgi:hypothetical protein
MRTENAICFIIITSFTVFFHLAFKALPFLIKAWHITYIAVLDSKKNSSIS